MDKKLILAVAGSGKTYYIVQELNLKDRFLLITFTISGTQNLQDEIVSRFGYMPVNIKVRNYFSFLYSFCYKPFHGEEMGDKGIYWEIPKNIFNQSYFTAGKYLYYNKISKLLLEKSIADVQARLSKYYDYVLVDEIQDFGGNDFNLLAELSKSNVKMLFVGDFFQHTFDTSRDRNTNANLHKDFDNFVSRFKKMGVEVDLQSLIKSRRCSKTTCDFIRSKLGVEIHSLSDYSSECRVVNDAKEVEQIFNDNSIVKLFYNMSYEYACRADNWGACKGLTYENVCVIISDEITKCFKKDEPFVIKSAITKNKFYVACSRSRNNLYFIPQKAVKDFKKPS